eukprot:gene38765-50943_t
MGMKVKTQSKKVNKAWLNQHVNDPYVRLAKKDGYRARAAYKLKELDETLGLIRPGDCVVDLGSAPGAWSQYARRRLSPQGAAVGELHGTIIALDMLPMEDVEGVHFILGDFREEAVLAELEQALTDRGVHQVDVVLSDMAPNLSGIGMTDAARITDLVELAVDFSVKHLKTDGALVVKLFHGGAYDPMVALFRQTFRTVKAVKPKASRDKSSETFLVGMGLKSTELHLNNQWFSKIAVWMVIAMVLFTVFKQFDTRSAASAGYMGYSEFLDEVKARRIKSATIQEGQGGTEIVAVTQDDRRVRTTATYLDRGLVGDLINNDVKFDVRPREEGSLLMTLLVSWGPMLLLI